MFEKESKEYSDHVEYTHKRWGSDHHNYGDVETAYQIGAELAYNKVNEWHNLNENSNDLPNEGEWIEGLYLYYYKDKVRWDVFKVRWYYEIGELDEKLIRWYSADENSECADRDYWNKVDAPDYWRRIVLPTRNEYDRNY